MPWQSRGSRAARVHKCVAVVDRSPGRTWGPWRPRWARWTPHAESHAGVPRLPLLPFQSIHPGTPRPSRESDLSLVAGPPIRTRGSSEAGLTLGSFLGGGQCSAVRAEERARLSLLTLGSRDALLAFGAQVSLWPGWSGEASEARTALGAWHARQHSVLLRHVDDRSWGSRRSRESWLPHSILPWVSFLSLSPLFSFWSLGSSCTLSAWEAGEARCSVCSNFSLAPWWPHSSRIPLDSGRARRSLQPVSTSGC